MLTTLIDISSNTPVAQLPTIMNYNNKAITEEFDSIYDSSTNMLKCSLYNPIGSVRAHKAEFTTLTLDNLVLRKTDAIKNTVKNTINDIAHNDISINSRFSTPEIASNYGIKRNSVSTVNICHDASTIIIPDSSITNILRTLNTNNSETIKLDDTFINLYQATEILSKTLAQVIGKVDAMNDSKISTASESVNYDNEISTFSTRTTRQPATKTQTTVYPASYMQSSPIILRRLNVPKLHIDDLLKGNNFAYYNIVDTKITIDNSNIAVLDSNTENLIVHLSFTQKQAKNYMYKVLLSRLQKKYLVIETDQPELTKVQLICETPYNSTNGTEWQLSIYSLPSTSTKINIITES